MGSNSRFAARKTSRSPEKATPQKDAMIFFEWMKITIQVAFMKLKDCKTCIIWICIWLCRGQKLSRFVNENNHSVSIKYMIDKTSLQYIYIITCTWKQRNIFIQYIFTYMYWAAQSIVRHQSPSSWGPPSELIRCALNCPAVTAWLFCVTSGKEEPATFLSKTPSFVFFTHRDDKHI